MGKTANKPSPRRKQRGGRPRKEWSYYVVEITDWDWGFFFGMSNMRDLEGPYMDYRHVELTGKLLRPATVNASSVEITLRPDARLNVGARERNDPKMVGSLQLHRGNLRVSVSIPLDSLGTILQMLIANRLHYMVVEGDKLHYGEAIVRTFHINMTLTSDDLPPEEQTGKRSAR